MNLQDGWDLHEEHLRRRFTFKDFREAMRFVNKIAELAEKAGHHPDMEIKYNHVEVRLTTHDARGLTEKDFDLAKEIDGL